jgi:hypothetical protein
MTNILKTKKLGFLLIAIAACIFYVPLKMAMQPGQTIKTGLETLFLQSMQRNGHTTIYRDGKTARTLDIGIFLEYQNSKIEELDDLLLTFEASNCITGEESAILSASLIRNLVDCAHKKYSFVGEQNYKETLGVIRNIFLENKFSIFITNNKEFVIFIPHSKYPGIKKAEDLSTIGLNYENLHTFMTYEDKVLDDLAKSEELYNELLEQSSLTNKINYLINIETLVDIFLPKRVVDIRVFLYGHGQTFEHVSLPLGKIGFKFASIAQLENDQYRKLRDTLDLAGCSFLYVKSCHSGSNVYKAQTLHLKEVNSEIKKPLLGLSSKYFIEIATSLPGSSTKAWGTPDYPDFFTNLNNFF